MEKTFYDEKGNICYNLGSKERKELTIIGAGAFTINALIYAGALKGSVPCMTYTAIQALITISSFLYLIYELKHES